MAPHNVVVSPQGIIHVLAYNTDPLSVRIHFHPDAPQAIYVRLLVGHTPVPTIVRELAGTAYGRWLLDATLPPFDNVHSKVKIAVQALNDDNSILDSVTFAEFLYPSKPSLRISTDPPPPERPALRRPNTRLPTPSRSKQRERKARLHRRIKPQSLIRTNHAAPDQLEDLYAQTPILDLVTPLSTLCTGWSPAELHAGRRLVRFAKLQDGRKLVVSCEPVSQEDYCENDSVISCIYREESESCFVTSVDIIYLLERLTNDDFPVEEKNRIRRNLEGLRPTTVSKHKSGFEQFFQRIMEFPDPKPRNIEKDLKVFDWSLLGQALEKILSKYSIYTSTVPESAASSPSLEPSFTDSPQALGFGTDLRDSYIHPDIMTKYEPPPDDIPFLTSSDESDSHHSPLSPAGSSYPTYTSDTTKSTEGDSSSGSWAADYKPADMGFSYDALNAFEVPAEPSVHIDNYAGEAGYPYNSYDSIAYQDGLSHMPEHYL